MICEYCGENEATATRLFDAFDPDGRLIEEWIDVCDGCTPEAIRKREIQREAQEHFRFYGNMGEI